jgi:hypothetical protein
MDEINGALKTYQQKWEQLVTERTNQAFFAYLKPTAVGWKVEDRTGYNAWLAQLHDQADHIMETWMNGRWVAKVHLREGALSNGATIVKIMERRPNSSDAVGLDHVDFLATTELAWNKEVLTAEPDLKWSLENNDIIAGYEWLSVWFDGTEAKVKDDTVLDIVIAELSSCNQKIIAG